MASFKSVFFLFGIAFVSQAQGAIVHLKDDITPLDIFKNALYQAQPIVADVLLAVQQVINAPNDFDSIQKKLVAEVTDINTNIADTLIEELKIVAEDSSIIGPNLPKCIKSSESDIVGVLATFTQDYTSCIKEDLVKYAPSFQSLVDSLIKMHNDDVAISQEFGNCKKWEISGITCMVDVIYKIIFHIRDTVPELWSDIEPVIFEFSAFADVAVQCAKDTVPTLLANQKKIIHQVKTCNNA